VGRNGGSTEQVVKPGIISTIVIRLLPAMTRPAYEKALGLLATTHDAGLLLAHFGVLRLAEALKACGMITHRP